MNFNNLKPLFGLALAFLLLCLGFYLIENEDQLSIIIGYVNIVFWSGIILFALYKFITKKKV